MSDLFHNKQDVLLLDNSIVSVEPFSENNFQILTKQTDNSTIFSFQKNFTLYAFTNLNDFYLSFDLPLLTNVIFDTSSTDRIRTTNLFASESVQSAFTYIINSISYFEVRLGEQNTIVTSPVLNVSPTFRNVYMCETTKEKSYGLNVQQSTHSTVINKYLLSTQLIDFQYNSIYPNRNYTFNTFQNRTNNYSKTFDYYGRRIFREEDGRIVDLNTSKKQHIVINFGDLDPFFKQKVTLRPGISMSVNIEFEFKNNLIYTWSQNLTQYYANYEETINVNDFLQNNNLKIFGKKYRVKNEVVDQFKPYANSGSIESNYLFNIINLRWNAFIYKQTPIIYNQFIYDMTFVFDYVMPSYIMIFINSERLNYKTKFYEIPYNKITSISDKRSDIARDCEIYNLDFNPVNGWAIKRFQIWGPNNFEYDESMVNIMYKYDNNNLDVSNRRVKSEKNFTHQMYNSGVLKIPINNNQNVHNGSLKANQSLKISIELDPTLLFNSQTLPLDNPFYNYYLTSLASYKNEAYITNNNLLKIKYENR